MQAALKSLSIHLILFTALWLLVRSSLLTPKEIPLELIDIIQRASDLPPQNNPRPALKTAPQSTNQLPLRARLTPGKPSENSMPVANNTSSSSSASNEPAKESIAEEYEVGELPVLVNEVRVPYPPSAKAKKVQGAVIFDLVVGSNGTVTSAIPVNSPDPDLTAAALAAVKQFKFRPAHLNDKAVAIKIRYTYRFVLE